MAIVQISKIQQRAGNLVDLPQLDNAEFGWATDTNRLFIGRTGNNYTDENVEVLTSYSDISFSQVNGSGGGNFNIVGPQNGQILTYVSSTDTWENYSGNTSQFSGGKLQLGNVSNLSMTGASAPGYVLQTDGAGNLSWTPQGTLYTKIIALSNANPIVMTVANTTPYTNNAAITISGVTGASNSIVNGQTFYVQLASNFPTTGNVSLYSSQGTGSPVNGAGLTYTNSPNAIATSSTGAGGGGTVGSSSANTVQFNDTGVITGNTSFTYNKLTNTLTVSTGNIVTGNLNAVTSITAPILVSNVATGTAPLTVTSTSIVPNLYVARANVSDYGVVTTRTSGTFYPTFVNANTTGNLSLSSNANLSFNAATGALISTLYTGTLTTNAQPNITSVGTLLSLAVTGNTTSGNLIGTFANGTSNIAIPAASGNINITAGGNANIIVVTGTGVNVAGTLNTGTGNANVGNIGSGIGVFTGNVSAANLVGPQANGNSNIAITLNGNIAFTSASNTVMTISNTGVNVSNYTFNTGTGNANVGNLGTSGRVIASILESNVATGTAPLTIASTTRVNNLNVSYANVTDYTAMAALTTGIWYPAFVPGTAVANYAQGSNTAFSANIANGAFIATTFVGALSGAATSAGTVTTAAQPNITSVGTLTSLGVNGTLTAVNLTANTGVITGTLATGAQPNITSVGTLTSVTVSANVSTGGIKTDNYYYANGVSISFAGSYSNSNVAAYLPTFAGTVGATALTTGANTTAGTITGNWGLSAGSKLTATYADLAEYYEADKPYEPGTVVEFGGEKEVTIAEDGTTKVAGVVSTNPAYVMNSQCQGEHVVALALQGRVPVKVRGTIHKGDMLVSAGDGYARPMIHPYIGSVIGKALENFEGEGVIEVAVGRL
jgi:hypothetical protein